MDFLIVFSAKYLVFLLGLGWLLSLFTIQKNKRKLYFGFFIVAFVFAIIGDKIFGLLLNNPRPFVVEAVKPLVEHTADNGFPSGHTLFSTVLATTAFSYNRKLGIVLGILAVVVGVGRVLANVHYPIDIIGSIVLAFGVSYLAWIVANKYFKKI